MRVLETPHEERVRMMRREMRVIMFFICQTIAVWFVFAGIPIQ